MGVRVHIFSHALARPGNLLSNILFCLPYEVAIPSETNSAKERPNVRNAPRALRALKTPEEKLVRREIRNEKDKPRRRAKTKQKQVAK